MINFTHRKKGSPGFNFAFSVFFFLLFSTNSNAQQVNGIITDFSGYWRSDSAALNPVFPNTSHNVVAFKVGNTIYSTGVNNSLLGTKGVAYTAGNFKALPVTSITGTVPGPPIYIALAGNYDSVTAGFSNPPPTVKMKDVITDGINGLDIGTGVTNIPASAVMTFPVQSIDVNSIADAKPDILYSQIADPTTTNNLDTIYFTNAAGALVGRRVTVNWGTVPSLGTYTLDLYNLQVGATCDVAAITTGFQFNTTRNIRLTSFKLSDFGITSVNAASVTSLKVEPGGESDPAFMAYNSDAFVITPPTITTQPQTRVVCAGTSQSATFSVTATGTSDTYQWKKNGVNIAGATGLSYTVNPVVASSAGYYEVVVTNGGGTVTSNRAYLNTAINTQPSSQTVVTGNRVVLSVSATNASSFQWEKNGVNIAGATDSVYIINPLNVTDSGSYTVSAINATNSCATVLSSPAVITPVIIVYSKSTGNINIPATWGANTDGSGSTPVDFTRSEHTFVLSNRASGNTLTDLTIAGTLDVKNGIAIIANNTTLDVGWCIRTGTGSLSGSSSSGFTTRGNSNLYFTAGSQVLKNFTITGGTVNMLSNLTISGGVLPGKLNLTGGTLALGGNKITIASSSTTNTSMVTALGAGASITYGSGGAFVVERFIPAKRAFRFMSPAVTTTTTIKTNWMEGVVNPDRWTNFDPNPGYGTHITGSTILADSVDATQTFNPSLFKFNNSTQTWITIANSHGTLTAGVPLRLMVRGSRSVDLNNNSATPSNTIIRATGVLKTGTYTVGPSTLSTRVGDFNFVGNPYACPVNWLTLTKSGLSNSYYTWDATLSRRGTYVAYNGTSQTNDKPTSLVDQNIQSGQAFFTETTSTTPSITFNETNKTSSNTTVFRTSNSMAKLAVQLLLSADSGSNNTADGFVAVYGDGFSKAIGDEDSYKFTNLDENMAINRNGISLSIEGRPFISDNDTLPIKIWQYRQKDYLIKIDGQNFDGSITSVLKDEYLKQESPIDLSNQTIIPFSINDDSASLAPDRFSILFTVNKTLPVTLTNIKAYQKDNGVQLEWNTLTETNIEQYEVEKSLDGVQFTKAHVLMAKSGNGGNEGYSWFDQNVNNGNNFYRIKIIHKAATPAYTAIERVNINKTTRSVTVFPNPNKGNTISLQLQGLEEGEYAVDIFNASGHIVYNGSIKHTGGSATKTLQLKPRLAAGNYTLKLTGNGNNITTGVLVQ